MQKLVCVGGPLAGQVYEVDRDETTVLIPRQLAQGLDPEVADFTVEVYAVSRVMFCNRLFPALLHPPLRSQGYASQEHAIVEALCKPEVYDAWSTALRMPETPE